MLPIFLQNLEFLEVVILKNKTKDLKDLIVQLATAIHSRDYVSFATYLWNERKKSRNLTSLIQNLMQNQPNKEIGEILQTLQKELQKIIRNNTSEKALDIIDKSRNYLFNELKTAEIEESVITPIVDNLEYYIRQYIKSLDEPLYDALLELNERMKELDERVEDDNKFEEGMKLLHVDGILDTNISRERFRSKEIKEIKQRFNVNHSGILFLAGRPGIGKTTLAKLYANISGKNSIYFLKYSGSFEETLGTLSKKSKSDAWKEVLNYWKSLKASEKQQILLIIDNFNDDSVESLDSSYSEKLNTGLFGELKNLGIQIVITTRINVENNVYMVEGVNESITLFEAYYKKQLNEEEKDNVKTLIQLVHNNTLLLALCAGLVRNGCLLKNVINSIRECNIKVEDIFVERQADFESPEKRIRYTIYEQVAAILNMDNLLKSTENIHILANMALLPLNGMNRQQFIKFIHKDSTKWINCMKELILRSWIIEEGDNVCLHPVVREILLDKGIISWTECKEYCQSLMDVIDLEYPFQSRMKYKPYAEEVYKHLGETHDIILAELFYNLSDIYDQIGDRAMSRAMVDNVVEYLDEMDDSLKKVRMYSGIAYSYNNKVNNIEDLKQATHLLDKAENILNGLKTQYTKLDYYSSLAHIYSNRGSNELAWIRYEEYEVKKDEHITQALDYHKRALEFRKKIANIAMRSVATSYTGIATCNYKLQQYEESVSNHQSALKIREEYEPGKVAINQQRMLGSTIQGYKKNHSFDIETFRLELEFYPNLLQKNRELENKVTFLENVKSFNSLYEIIFNDERAIDLRALAEDKKKIVDKMEF